jgi:hypothetical protein
LHAVANVVRGEPRRVVAIDLAALVDEARATARALRAADRVRDDAPSSRTQMAFPPEPSLDATTGFLMYAVDNHRSIAMAPLRDGAPALKGGTIVRVRKGGDVLAAFVEGPLASGLYFVARSRGEFLGVFAMDGNPAAKMFALSRDGRRFARLVDDYRLEVRDVPGDAPPVLVTAREDVSIHFASLGRSCLLVREFDEDGPRHQRASCLVRWDRGRLEFAHHHAELLLGPLGGVVADSRGVSLDQPAHRDSPDPRRWAGFIAGRGLRIVIDRYNHLAVLRRSGGLIAMFSIHRDEAAAWMPDGTRLGARRLIGGEPTAGAAERLAAALSAAEAEEGTSA